MEDKKHIEVLSAAADNWKGMIALTGSFIAGTLFIGTLSGFVGLPGNHARDIEEINNRLVPIEQYIANQNVLICIQTQQALERPVGVCTAVTY